MEVGTLIEILKDMAPDLSSDLMAGITEERRNVNKIGVCIDPNEQNIYSAAAKSVEILISYHPWLGEAAQLVNTKKMGIIPLHTAWDNTAEGINNTFAKAVGLTGIYTVNTVTVGLADLLFRDLLERCQRVLDLNVLPYYGELKFPVKKIGIWAGPGFLPHNKKIWEICVGEGCDTIVSGELSLAPLRYAAAKQLKLLDLGHSAITKPGMSHLADLLKYRLKALDCSIEFFEGYYACGYYTKSFFLQQDETDESLSLFNING